MSIHSTVPATRLTWSYLVQDSKLIHAAWQALTEAEQREVVRQIIAAVGQQEDS